MDKKTVAARIAGERQRCIENILARTERPRTLWWLSFADGTKPEGSQFLGTIILHSNDFMEAITESHLLGINPGGECQGCLLPDLVAVDDKWKARLLTQEECGQLDAEMCAQLDAKQGTIQ